MSDPEINSDISLYRMINVGTFPSKLFGMWVINERMEVQKFLVIYCVLIQTLEFISGAYCIYDALIVDSYEMSKINLLECIFFSLGSIFLIKRFIFDASKLTDYIALIRITVNKLNALKTEVHFEIINNMIFAMIFVVFLVIYPVFPRVYAWEALSPFVVVLLSQQTTMFSSIGNSLVTAMVQKARHCSNAELQQICRLHNDVCFNFNELFNSFYQYNALFVSSVAFVSSVNVALKFAQYRSTAELIIEIITLVMTLLSILIASSSSQQTTDKSGDLLKVIYSRMVDEEQFLDNHGARLFLKYKERMKINVCGFFYWDRPFFMSMVATLLTDFIILIQEKNQNELSAESAETDNSL